MTVTIGIGTFQGHQITPDAVSLKQSLSIIDVLYMYRPCDARVDVRWYKSASAMDAEEDVVRNNGEHINSMIRWPRKAMSITDFNFFHFQFGNFSLPISNLQIYHYQFHFFVLPISNLYISCYQIGNFSLPNCHKKKALVTVAVPCIIIYTHTLSS